MVLPTRFTTDATFWTLADVGVKGRGDVECAGTSRVTSVTPAMLSRNDMLSTEVCRAYLTASLAQAPHLASRCLRSGDRDLANMATSTNLHTASSQREAP